MNMNYVSEAKALKDQVIGWRRELHQIPELGTKLPQTMKYISGKLTEMGIEHQVKDDISCIWFTLGQGEPCLMLRADVDALPGNELSGLPFASTNGCMHSCGHDMHGAVMLGVSKALKEHEAELKGTVKVLFQSAEETFQGAKAAIAQGVLENPKVDAAFGMHIFASQNLGSLAYNDILMGAVYGFKITITGVGGHGSQPERCIDPINAGVEVYQALHALIAREKPPLKAAALTIGQFAAGEASNVIPEVCVLQGTLRTFDPEVRALLIKRINEIVPAVCTAYRCKCEIEELSNVPSLVCDTKLSEEIRAGIDEIGVITEYLPGTQFIGSEDFALYAEKVPSVYYTIGAGPEDKSLWFGQHNPKIVFNEEAMEKAIAIFLKTVDGYFENHK